MFVRAKRRFKDGKEHRYWSVLENCRNRDGRVVQRQVLYLGEINDSQRSAWCRSIEVLQGDCGPAPIALFPDDREAPELHCETVRIHVKELSVHRPRQWGGCWLALTLWDRLELDRFWAPRRERKQENVEASAARVRLAGVRRSDAHCGAGVVTHVARSHDLPPSLSNVSLSHRI